MGMPSPLLLMLLEKAHASRGDGFPHAIASMTHYDEYSLGSGQLKGGVDYVFDQRFSACAM